LGAWPTIACSFSSGPRETATMAMRRADRSSAHAPFTVVAASSAFRSDLPASRAARYW
jgi:hypothetical protein